MSDVAAVIPPTTAPQAPPPAAPEAKAEAARAYFPKGKAPAAKEPKPEAKPEAKPEPAKAEAPAEAEKPAEAVAEEPKAEPPPEPVAKAFISLKRQKRELAEKERIIQRREVALAAAQREHNELMELRKNDPWEYAHRMGFNARDVAKRAVDESSETPEAKALKEITETNKRLEAELKELKEGLTTQTESQRNAADIAAIQSVIGDHDCPFLQDEPIEEVTQAFKTVYKRDYEPAGLPLNSETAAEIFAFMESNLRSIYEGKIQRVQKARGAVQAVPSERGNGAVKTAKPEVTLSNIEAAQVASAPAKLSITDPRSAAERKARALALIRFKDSD